MQHSISGAAFCRERGELSAYMDSLSDPDVSFWPYVFISTSILSLVQQCWVLLSVSPCHSFSVEQLLASAKEEFM